MRLASPFKQASSVRRPVVRQAPRPLFAWLLGFALLFAQMGAAVHALEHGHDLGAPESAHCELCLAYAGLGGAAPAASAPPTLPATGDWSPRAHPPLPPCLRAARARIRAPPVFSWPT